MRTAWMYLPVITFLPAPGEPTTFTSQTGDGGGRSRFSPGQHVAVGGAVLIRVVFGDQILDRPPASSTPLR